MLNKEEYLRDSRRNIYIIAQRKKQIIITLLLLNIAFFMYLFEVHVLFNMYSTLEKKTVFESVILIVMI